VFSGATPSPKHSSCNSQVAVEYVIFNHRNERYQISSVAVIGNRRIADDLQTISLMESSLSEIIELAKAGERNPDLLCKGALEKLHGHFYGD
jgi:hypothetical protein